VKRKPRIAIVSDPLVQRGGAERFAANVLGDLFPDAPIYPVIYSAKTGPAEIADRVVPTFLQKIPWGSKRHRWLLPLYPSAVESMDLREFDIIISSHYIAAKGILRRADQRHICYCHTPMRALWERPHEELAELPRLLRPLAAQQFSRLRQWDYVTASRVDLFLANSELTRQRIRRFYGCDSRVLYSPIDARRFTPSIQTVPQEYYLAAQRLVSYKRVDIAVEATARLGRKLVVVGTGPDRRGLDQKHVEYLGHVSNEKLIDLMQHAKALLFPALEDFGLTPVEMMAAGRPVVAYGAGGALETVVDGVTGVFAPDQTAESFAQAIRRFEGMSFTFDDLVTRSHQFSPAQFKNGMLAAVEEMTESLASTRG
jgi:glycosyltransferase involved in cell wall biosynthesis